MNECASFVVLQKLLCTREQVENRVEVVTALNSKGRRMVSYDGNNNSGSVARRPLSVKHFARCSESSATHPYSIVTG